MSKGKQSVDTPGSSQDGEDKTACYSTTGLSLGSGIKPIDLKSNNMPYAWKSWYTQLIIYLRANNLDTASDQRKVAILLHFIGTDALTIFYSFDVDIDKITFII